MTSLPPPSVEHRISQPSVRISSASGRVNLVAEDRADIDVRGDAAVSRIGDTTTITGDNSKLAVRVPTGIDVIIGTTSGRVDVAGLVGAAAVTTDSGRIRIEPAASVDARSNSGRIEIDHCGQQCCLRSNSGAVAVGSCGAADVATTNGRISLGAVRGVARAHCTSGRVDITMAAANDVSAETLSGRIDVSMPPGVRAFCTDLADGPVQRPDDVDCVVATHSVTGRIDVANR